MLYFFQDATDIQDEFEKLATININYQKNFQNKN